MRHFFTYLLALCLVAPAASNAADEDTYDQDEIAQKVENFFGSGAKNLSEVIEKAFEDHGSPNAYIQGEEASAALGVGVRYGKGLLQMKDGESRRVYWQGPSVGFDIGANVSKVFVLIYKLPSTSAIFQRYPGVEGSLYFVGGVGMNYLQSGDTVMAPIRFGAGWRQGVNAGYMDFTQEASVNPF